MKFIFSTHLFLKPLIFLLMQYYLIKKYFLQIGSHYCFCHMQYNWYK